MKRGFWSVLLVGGMLLLAACNANNGSKEMNGKPATEMKDGMKDDTMVKEDKDMMGEDGKKMMDEDKDMMGDNGKMMDESKEKDGM